MESLGWYDKSHFKMDVYEILIQDLSLHELYKKSESKNKNKY